MEREKAPYKVATFKSEGREINTDAEIKKVDQFLQSVFKVYTEGTPEEIDYYFEKSNITNGLKGIMTFSKLENLRIYEDKEGKNLVTLITCNANGKKRLLVVGELKKH